MEGNVLFNGQSSYYVLNIKESHPSPSLQQNKKTLNQCIYKKPFSQTFQCCRCKYAEGRVAPEQRSQRAGANRVTTTNRRSRLERDGRVVIRTGGTQDTHFAFSELCEWHCSESPNSRRAERINTERYRDALVVLTPGHPKFFPPYQICQAEQARAALISNLAIGHAPLGLSTVSVPKP